MSSNINNLLVFVETKNPKNRKICLNIMRYLHANCRHIRKNGTKVRVIVVKTNKDASLWMKKGIRLYPSISFNEKIIVDFNKIMTALNELKYPPRPPPPQHNSRGGTIPIATVPNRDDVDEDMIKAALLDEMKKTSEYDDEDETYHEGEPKLDLLSKHHAELEKRNITTPGGSTESPMPPPAKPKSRGHAISQQQPADETDSNGNLTIGTDIEEDEDSRLMRQYMKNNVGV